MYVSMCIHKYEQPMDPIFCCLGVYDFTLSGKQIIQANTSDTIGVLTKVVFFQIKFKHDFAVKESEGNKINTHTHIHKQFLVQNFPY